jgi:hypothetical protein
MANAAATGLPVATDAGPEPGKRAGKLELRVPRLRTGSHFSRFLEPRRLAEKASRQIRCVQLERQRIATLLRFQRLPTSTISVPAKDWVAFL